MSDERPPQDLFDGEKRKETDEEKEARERCEWEDAELDVDPSLLALKPRDNQPPRIRPFKLNAIGPDYVIGFFGKRRG